MLTRDLLRAKIDRDRLTPQYIKATPAQVDLAERILACFREHLHRQRQALDDALNPVVYRSRSLIVGRGLVKIVRDAASFTEPEHCMERRWEIFAASAAALSNPCSSPEAHRLLISEQLGEEASELYADLPQHAMLEDVPNWSAQELLQRYNIGLTQGYLLQADSLQIRLPQATAATCRAMISQLRFRRLVADIRESSEAIQFDVAGPASVLGQSQRYGMQLAQFFPQLLHFDRWSLVADVTVERRSKQLVLDQQSGLHPLPQQRTATGFVPEEIRSWHQRLSKQKGWEIDSEPLIISAWCK